MWCIVVVYRIKYGSHKRRKNIPRRKKTNHWRGVKYYILYKLYNNNNNNLIIIIIGMGGYHSEWNELNQPTICGMGVTPIRTKFKVYNII